MDELNKIRLPILRLVTTDRICTAVLQKKKNCAFGIQQTQCEGIQTENKHFQSNIVLLLCRPKDNPQFHNLGLAVELLL